MYDVAGRLAEGRPSVDTFEHYAQACAALGSGDAGGEVQRAYTTEDGLDLQALDADHGALLAAADTVHDALSLQNAQLGALDEAWSGAAADASTEVLRRHADASSRAAAAVSAAAAELAALRDELWRLVDAKAATAQEVDARTDGVRDAWLSAAQTVTTGVGDQATASELVDRHVQPFVAADVRGDLVAAMTEVTDRIAQRFDTAIAQIGGQAATRFPEPGAVGQTWSSGVGAPAVDPGAGGGAPWGGSPAAATPPAAMAPPATDPAGFPSGGALPGGGGGGLPGTGSGLSGLSQMFGDLLGSLLPGDDALGEADLADDAALDPDDDLDLDDPEEDDDQEDDAKDDTEDDEGDPQTDDSEGDTEEGADDRVDQAEQADEAEPAPTPGPPQPAAEAAPPPAPTPTPAEPVAGPVAPSGPEPATPCEIAADELPQAGE